MSTRALIVDDEPGNIKILSSVLAGDYALSVATGGAQALQIAEIQAPDIVLLDVEMPDLDGFAVCRELRKLPKGMYTPIVMVTGRDDIEIGDDALGYAETRLTLMIFGTLAGVTAARLAAPAAAWGPARVIDLLD